MPRMEQQQQITNLVLFSEFLKKLGRSESTGWRWRKEKLIATLNLCGKLYVTREEIRKFEDRAIAGEFSKAIAPPRRTTL